MYEIYKQKKVRGCGEIISLIKTEEWRQYFMNFLSDTEVDAQEKEEMEAKNREEGQEVEELKEEEIRETLKKMKNKKTMGSMEYINGIPMEVWKYAEDTLQKDMMELWGQVWRKGEIEDQRQSIIAII